MNHHVIPVLILVAWTHTAAASGQEAWLGRVPDFRAVCSPQTLDLEDPDPADWTALQESLPEEVAANLGAWLVLPANAPSLAAGAAESGEAVAAEPAEPAAAQEPEVEQPGKVPCAQYFGGAPLPEDLAAREVLGGPALFFYCPGSSPVPCYAHVRELLVAGGSSGGRLTWSRTVLGWVDDEGRPYAEPETEQLEAAVAIREFVREPPDGEAVLGPVGFVVVAHLDEGEVSDVTRALAPQPEGEGGG